LDAFSHTLGCGAALASAAAWALGAILLHRVSSRIPAAGLNFSKAITAMIFLGLAVLAGGSSPMSGRDFILLGLSGILGIALADTWFFKALQLLGPRLTLMLEPLIPVCTIILALAVLKENLTLTLSAGILLVLIGINLAVRREGVAVDFKVKWMAGIIFSLLSSFAMAGGIILAKMALASSAALDATLVRMVWAVAGLSLWGALRREIKSWIAPLFNRDILRDFLLGMLVIIFGGFWLSMVALKYTYATTATILNSTAPLFILPLTWWFLKEKIASREAIGALLAVSGIVLVLAG